MKIFVCIKQVPDTEAKIKFGPNNQLDPAGIKWVMNPYDEYAVEEAIKLKEKSPGSEVWVITLGPKARVAEVLRTALAMGADEGVLIDCPSPLEHLPIAQALAQVIRKEGDAKVIFTGKLAIDDNAATVSQMLAELLGIPHATVVSKFSLDGEKINVERDADGGAKELLQLLAPAVIAANRGLNTPRYASLPGIMKAKKKVLKEIPFDSLGISSAPTIKILDIESPKEKPPVKIMSGDIGSQVSTLVQLLRNEAKVL